MEQLSSELHWKMLLIYRDDIVAISPDYVINVMKPSKGAILQPEVKSLGYVVGQDSIATDQVKIQAVEELTISPSSPKTSMSCGHSWAW